MSDYRRLRQPGATVFFTVVTYKRSGFLCEPVSRNVLRGAIKAVRQSYPFRIDAWVLLPDHIHCIWTLPLNDGDYSKRWGLTKRSFTSRIRSIGTLGVEQREVVQSRRKRREAGVWQRRFWEHVIRDMEDFKRHCDYIHYNPVKHGLVDRPGEWPFTSFHSIIQRRRCPEGWGSAVSPDARKMNLE